MRAVGSSDRRPSGGPRVDSVVGEPMTRHFLASAVAVVGFMSAGAGPAWADGYEFFTVDRGRRVNLVYVGQIREKTSGRIVREPAYFMVTDKRSGMTFPFVNDRPGHYRSPDIGESVEELAGTAVKPSDLEFELVIEGYKKVKSTSVPRKDKGVVEVNFSVERDAANASTGADSGGERISAAAGGRLIAIRIAAERGSGWQFKKPIDAVDLHGRGGGHDHCRSSGAYIRPPSVHRPLSRRSSRSGLFRPTFRSNTSP